MERAQPRCCSAQHGRNACWWYAAAISRLRRSASLAVGAVLATVCLGSAATDALAGSANSVKVSGQLAGTLAVNTAASCRSSSLDFANGTGTRGVALTLTDHTVKPTQDSWQVIIYVLRTGTTHFVATTRPSSPSAELSIATGGNVAWEWVSKSGTATIASDWKHGTFDLVLAPDAVRTHAVKRETVVGSWTCG